MQSILDIFAVLVILVATAAGAFLLWRAWANRAKSILALTLFFMGAAKLCVAALYVLLLLGKLAGAAVDVVTVGVLLRPLLPLLLALPAVLVLELGI